VFANAGIATSNYILDSILNPVTVLEIRALHSSSCVWGFAILPTGGGNENHGQVCQYVPNTVLVMEGIGQNADAGSHDR
jgi:hypothetical protein